MTEDIKLGDKVKDMITGFEGIAVARVSFLNGCKQYMLEKQGKSNEIPNKEGAPTIDVYNLKVIKRHVVDSCEYPKEEIKIKKETGGPTKFMQRMKGY